MWQTTSNICGHIESPIENLTLRNVLLELEGGATEFEEIVPERKTAYPEVYVLGRVLPAKGIYFRRVNGLTLENVQVKTLREDCREDFVFEKVTF